jgi:hypothetical protein
MEEETHTNEGSLAQLVADLQINCGPGSLGGRGEQVAAKSGEVSLMKKRCRRPPFG